MDNSTHLNSQSMQDLQRVYFEEESLLKEQYRALGNLGLQIIFSIAKNPSVYYVFCPWGSGDTLTVAAYLHYIREYRSVQRLTLVCKKNQTDIADMFDAIDDCIAIGADECDAITIASCLSLATYGPNYMVGNLSLIRKASLPHRLLPYKLFVLQVPENAVPEKVSEKFFTPYDTTLAEEWKNQVLLAPYAVAFPLLPDSFWEKLVQALNDAGFQVVTNVYGEEKPITGSERLEVSVREAFQLARYAAGVISYRSGFSDILALQPELPHVVVNPDTHTMSFDDCSVLGDAKKLLNLVYDEAQEDELINRILSYFACTAP